MGYFTAQLISAVKLGNIYALVAIGYSIVYSIMGMINFAHGELLMIATFSLWVLLNAGVPFGIAVVLAILITALFGILIERIAYRSIRNAGESTQIITSLAVSIFLEALCQAIFNSSSKAVESGPPEKAHTTASRPFRRQAVSVLSFKSSMVISNPDYNYLYHTLCAAF